MTELPSTYTFAPQRLSNLSSGNKRTGMSKNICPPVWYDHEKFRRGQLFFCKHIASVTLSMHMSLIAGFSLSNLLDTLVFTNKSDTPKKALKRYILTFYHIFLWMTEDICDTSSKGYKSLMTVKGMHNHTASAMKEAGEPGKIYISQYDMAIVQSGFFAAVLMYPSEFGIKCTIKELEDYVYTWRVIGYLLGIDDEYNICGHHDYIKTYSICKEIQDQLLHPGLMNPPKHFTKMVNAYIDGINLPFLINTCSQNSALALLFSTFGIKRSFKLSVSDWLRICFFKFYVFLMYYIPFIKNFLNQRVMNNFCKRIESLLIKDIELQMKYFMERSA